MGLLNKIFGKTKQTSNIKIFDRTLSLSKGCV